MRLTVAIPPSQRSSLQAMMGVELQEAVLWVDGPKGDVVIGLQSEGRLAWCGSWPGAEGALALVEAGYLRLKDQRNMERLHEVGRALASEQHLDRLLDLILTQARSLLSAEAGSIYLVEEEGGVRELLFAHTQNARVSLPYHRFRVPISAGFMAGFVALKGESVNIPDVYQIPPESPYRFNDSFDRQAGYHTTSMLVVPLKDTEGEVLGVLQLINRTEGDGFVVPFRAEHQDLLESLAAQAGVAVRNAKLRQEIEALFEGFVNASVTAIEQRDPVTSGHSGRVASLTVGLAEVINATPNGPFGPVFFSDRQLRELRYASLLHDFGKVGVREQVLVKSKKLEPNRLEMILQRLRQRQEERIRDLIQRDWEQGIPFDPLRWEEVVRAQAEEADRLMTLVRTSNEPSVLPEDAAETLGTLSDLRFTRWDGREEPLLDGGDLACLRIRKGSLSDGERLEIESHVTHTFQFLKRIPWTRDLASVPEIAFAHHERLNGLGYPRRLLEVEIPVQSRAMAVSDVYDALTAQDRPYKKAVPLERSLGILESDARGGHLDPELLRLFIEAKVYLKTQPPPPVSAG